VIADSVVISGTGLVILALIVLVAWLVIRRR
jgi:uncharacterized protein (TIGR03382 family)